MGIHFFEKSSFSTSLQDQKQIRGMEGLTANTVEQLASGSTVAFETIYKAYVSRLLNRAFQFLRNRHNAEDICANVFVRLWEHRAQFASVNNIEAYLFISVRNACIDFQASAQGKMGVNTLPVEIADQFTAQEAKADIKTEYKERIRKKVRELPHQCRTIFELAYFEDLKNEEIASHLGISKKTVTNQKVKALNYLRVHQEALIGLTLMLWVSFL